MNHYTTRRNQGKLAQELSDLIDPYVFSMTALQETLQKMQHLFCSGERILPLDFENAIQYLQIACEQCHEFCMLIASPHHPITVDPLRLPLMLSLTDLKAHITKLQDLLLMQRSALWQSSHQPAEYLIEVRKAIKTLIAGVDDVSHQITNLLDRVRFKESEYQKKLLGIYRK